LNTKRRPSQSFIKNRFLQKLTSQLFLFRKGLFICFVWYCVALTILLCSTGCTDRANKSTKKAEWKIGYWYWQGYRDEDLDTYKEHVSIDLLYVRTSEYQTGGSNTNLKPVRMFWPENLPKADAYFSVFRCEGPACTNKDLVASLIENYRSLKSKAAEKGQRLIGLQIDYDCPTIELGRYGKLLRDVRQKLPKEDLLSITALLDWFGPGTEVSSVIRWTDEFVPQFYDVDFKKLISANGGIAEPIDPTRWAPILNSFRKPYRIGIATFGRIIEIPSSGNSRSGTLGMSPLQIMTWHKGRFIQRATSSAGEIIASFESTLSQNSEGGTMKMIIPTHDSVSSAFKAAKTIGGFCSGVIFFRYQVPNEALALSPEEVFNMISDKEKMQDATTVETEDGFCAAVSCNDLFIQLKDRFPLKDVVLTLKSSRDLEYFVPTESVQSKMTGLRSIELRIPAFAGVPRIPAGRAVSHDPVQFTVEERP
jgi:hypothetical protein